SLGTPTTTNVTTSHHGLKATTNGVKTNAESDGGEEPDNVVSLAEFIRASEERQTKALQELTDRTLAAEKEQLEALVKAAENKTPVNITVNVNGTNVGVEELETNVANAAMAGVVAAIRDNPSLIEHPYAVGS